MEVVDASSFWIFSCPAGRPAVGKCGRLFAHAGPNGPDCDGGRGAQNVRRQHISRPDSLGDGGGQGFREGRKTGAPPVFPDHTSRAVLERACWCFWPRPVQRNLLYIYRAYWHVNLFGAHVHVSYVRYRARSHTIRRGDNQSKNRLTFFSTSRVAHLPSRAARSRSSRYPQLELEWAFALA